MTGKKKRRSHTMAISVILPMVSLTLLNLILIFVLMYGGGVFDTLRTNSLDLLREHTQNKQLPLQQQMTGRWSALDNAAIKAMDHIERTLKDRGATPDDMANDAALNAALVQACAGDLLLDLRSIGTTGIYIVLDGIGVVGQEGTYAGVYLRDTDPDTIAGDNADVLMERGLPPVARAMGISLDSFWRAAFSFDEGEGGYFFRPMVAARQGSSRNARDYGCWSGPVQLDERDATGVIMYSMPLMDESGRVLGVIGAELTNTYLCSVINSGEYGRDRPDSFVLARSMDGVHYECVAAVGQTFRQHFGSENGLRLTLDQWENDDVAQLDGTRTGESVYAAVYPMRLYNHHTPFEHETWAVIGLRTSESIFSFSQRFFRLLLMAAVSALILGCGVALVTGFGITQKITELVRRLRSHPDDQALVLPPTGVQEIDILTDEVMRQNRKALGQSLRLSSVLSMTGTTIGMYEIRRDGQMSYCSRGVYEMFGVESPEQTATTAEVCSELLEKNLTDEVDAGVYRVQSARGPRYLRHRSVQLGASEIGTLMDVTVEMENRYRVERERDYDVLTGLLNRRAIARIASELFKRDKESLGTAAIMMMDLDNLKYINDTYGHDWGDSYIRCFAEALSDAFRGEHTLCARRSGDEFVMVMYGW